MHCGTRRLQRVYNQTRTAIAYRIRENKSTRKALISVKTNRSGCGCGPNPGDVKIQRDFLVQTCPKILLWEKFRTDPINFREIAYEPNCRNNALRCNVEESVKNSWMWI